MALHMTGLCILGLAFYMDFVQADMWLGNLLLERSDDIYRMKGILSVSGMPQRFVFQVFVTLAFSVSSSTLCL
jgi:G3E family GTPase